MLVCTRCQRANPAEAAFCYFDGTELRQVNGTHTARAPQRLPHEFVFPSGRRCSTYDELLRGCHEEWSTARDLLQQGVFHRFLAGGGRLDLAQAARRTGTQPDPDLALDAFLARLPAMREAGPRLDLNPRRLLLDNLHSCESKQVNLTIINQGKGLLHGTLAIEEGHSWLKLGEDMKDGKCPIKTLDRQEVRLCIDTHGLPAPGKYSAKLTAITNGGVAEIPLRVELTARPFTREPLVGVSTPREMAERMRAQPKAGVPLLENGEIARWFASNCWTYPVTEPRANGIAAVQQFFEGMGLSRPPPVRLAEDRFELCCLAGERIEGRLVLQTAAKKWIYARATTEARWLQLGSGSTGGPQQAVLPFEIDTRDMVADQSHEAVVHLQANGGQALSARVLVRVSRPPEAVRNRFLRPILAGAIAAAIARLLLALPADLYARTWAEPGGTNAIAGFARWLQPEMNNPEFIRHFVLATCWLGAILGARALWRRERRVTDLAYGAVTGLGGGLAVAATLACVLPQLDAGARLVYRWLGASTGWASSNGAGWLWCVLWILIASLTWAAMGAGVGFLLSCFGAPGRWIAAELARRLELLFGLFGLRSAASYFSVQ
jgi:hypothetical protein